VAQKHDRITTYGFDKSNAAWVRLAVAAQAGSRFSVTGGANGEVALRVTPPGRHNALNATAAYLAARQMAAPSRPSPRRWAALLGHGAGSMCG
jgi:UDP-N-acetylmuramate-alanine ligase